MILEDVSIHFCEGNRLLARLAQDDITLAMNLVHQEIAGRNIPLATDETNKEA